jgi:uncharacterized protein
MRTDRESAPDASRASAGITRAEARAISIAAQGFSASRPDRPADPVRIRELIESLGLLQLDSVNVFSRSHYMPVFSRLGPYDRSVLDGLAGHAPQAVERSLVEYWGHEASLMSFQTWRLLRWRFERVDREFYKPVIALARKRPDLLEDVLALVAARGPIRAGATAGSRPVRRRGEMWNWHDGKMALEYLFYAGKVTAAQRVNFERLYDLPERVLPAEIWAQPALGEAEAQRELIRIAARALGVASRADLADYFRLTRGDTEARVAELVDANELEIVDVEGWATPGYMPPAAGAQPTTGIQALLSPFDSLIWTRDRTLRIFEFAYHVEIYTPADRRQYGYYVLPFLLGDRLVARVDLKTDRKHAALLVQAAYLEPGDDPAVVASALAHELQTVAQWLVLADIHVDGRGDLAPALRTALQ